MARSTKCPHIYNLNKSLSFYNYLCLIKKHPPPYPTSLWSSRSCPSVISQKNKSSRTVAPFQDLGGHSKQSTIIKKKSRVNELWAVMKSALDCSNSPSVPLWKSVTCKESVLYYSHQVESRSPSCMVCRSLGCLCTDSF